MDFELKCNLSSLLDLGVVEGDAATAERPAENSRATPPQWGFRMKVNRYQHGSASGSMKQLSREERNLSPLELWVKKFCEDKAENRR